MMAFAGIAGLVLMVLLSRNCELVRKRLEGRGRLVRWLGGTLLALAAGVRPLNRPRVVCWVVLHSVLTWILIGLSTWLCILAAGADFPLLGVWLIMPLLVLGIAVPTPGGAGAYHAALKAGVMLFGATEVVALGAGILAHLAVTIPVLTLGLLLLWTEKISWRDMVSAARQWRALPHGAGDDPAPAQVG